MIVIIIYCQYLSQKYSIYRILIIEIYMQTCGCSLGSTQNQPFHRQSSAYKHCKSALYQSNPPYSLDEFEAGCGLKKYRKYGQYQTGNYKNNMTCSQFNSINFHRKCTCYLKLNLQCQCSCGMLPSMFHKLVCAPYITISKNKSSQQNSHQAKKTKTRKNCSNCHCKCHNKLNNKQKLDLLSDQQNYVPKTIQYQPQPTQIITYGPPPPPVYRPTPPQSIVSFKSVPTHSVRNIVPPSPPPPPNQIIIEPQRKNILRQVPVINEVVNQPVVRVSTGVQPSSNHGIFVLEQSKKSIKVPPPPPAPPINTSQTSIYQIPQQRMPIKMQPQQINPNFFNFLAAQQAMQRQHQAQLFKQQQNQQMMQNNEEDQQYEQEIEEEEYEEVQQDGDGQEN